MVIVLLRTVGVKADLQSGWCVSGRSLVGLWFRIARLSIYEKKKTLAFFVYAAELNNLGFSAFVMFSDF